MKMLFIYSSAGKWEGDTYYEQRIVFNALSYATSKEKERINPIITHPVWLIEDIGKKTTNLSIPPGNNLEGGERIT